MPVTLQTVFKPLSPSYDRIHLESLSIELEQNNYAKARIDASLRLYSTDGNGNKTFSAKTWEIHIHDAEEFAMGLAMKGDMRGAQADIHIKALVALLAETCTDLGATSVE